MKIKEKPLTHTEKAIASVNLEALTARCNAFIGISQSHPDVFEKRIRRLGVQGGNLLTPDLASELVSRELGFNSWTEMSALVEEESASFDSMERAVVAAAYVGNVEKARLLYSRHHLLLRDSPSVALALGLEGALELTKKIDVNQRMGPMGWHPLVYACCVHSSQSKESRIVRRDVVRSMLSKGADASVGCLESDTIRGYLTVLGGAVGRCKDQQIARQLLKAGAGIDDGPTLYEGSAIWHAVKEDDVGSVNLLLESKPPLWHLCHALPHAIDLGSKTIIASLLKAGADPNWDKTALSYRGGSVHEAVVTDAPPYLIEQLVAAGGSLTQRDNCGRTPLAVATALNRTRAIDLLRNHGAKLDECELIDRWFGECFAENINSATELSQSLPDPGNWRYEDHLWLRFATSIGAFKSVELMLEGGANPNAVDYDGLAALHCAAMLGDAQMCKLLVEAGADVETLDYEGRTPLDIALEDVNCQDDLIEILEGVHETRSPLRLSRSDMDAFEEAASSIPVGDLTNLRRICDERPHFARARSPRPHRCTLLNYVGVNGFEGERQVTPQNVLEIMNYLIDDLGSDSRALTYTYRGGPGNDTVGLLSSSDHPRERGLTMAMIHKLAKAGADVSDGWKFLVEMQDARTEGVLGAFLEGADMTKVSAVEAFIESTNLNDAQFVEALLRAGLDPNATISGGVRAIHQAAINGNQQLVELLLANGADPGLKDSTFDGTAAGWADAGGHEELATWIWQRTEKR